MEVVPAMSDASPFQRRDVAEWTHRDRLTGVVETARVETDRWAASSATAKHAYGKVVDSRNRSLPDGSAHQRQRQQLEVFQTKGPGGSLQVIRTQTVTSTNSSSSWRGGVATTGPRTALPAITQGFEDLQLSLNPLNLSSEKSKASVGRSGSISSRRPPSRPRSLVGRAAVTRACQDPPTPVARTSLDVNTSSGEVVAQSATIREVSEHSSTRSSKSSTVTLNGHLGISRKKSSSIEDLHNGASEERDDGDDGLKRSSKVRRSLQFPLKKLEARGGVCKLLQELEESSKRNASEGRIARRSFEALENVLKRNNSLTDSSNLSEREDGESPRDQEESNTNTEGETSDHYNHHSVNSVSIDDFARKFNSSRSKFILEKRHSLMETLDKSFHDDDEKSPISETKNLSKRHSFVTVESLKEVRGRLKRLNSPLDGLDTESGMEELDDNDDGIGNEESSKLTGSSITEIPQLRVKSYVYGIEGISRSPRPPVLGTGSLESRTSNKASVNGSRSDEWYNRRKSYGFESVHGDEAHSKSSALISKYDDTNRLTSTDSGICRSSDQFAFPSWKRKQQETDNTKPSETEILQVSHTIPISRTNKESTTTTTLSTNRENVRKGRTTVVTFGSKPSAQDSYTHNKEVDTVHRNGEAERTQTGAYTVKKTTTSTSEERSRVLCSQPMTVSIPVLPDDQSPSVVSRRLFFQQLAQSTSGSVEKPWNQPITKNENQSPSLIGSRKVDGDDWWRNSQKHTTGYSVNGRVGNEDWQASSKLSNGVMKRHSIAVDSSWKSFSNLNKSVHENLLPGPTDPGKDCYRPSQNPDESKRHSIAVDKLNYLHDDDSAPHVQQPREDADNFVSRKQKKVEFCKTEVHFAAEPGRINIVETDEKPPPNNMFRRRRRHSTPAADATKNTNNLPEVRFGDSVYEKQLLGGTEEMEESTLAPGGSARVPVLPVRVREEVYPETNCTVEASVVDEDVEHCNFESSLEPTPRSILKNYKKPKPYLIGENEDGYTSIDDQKEDKWGVRLRPVAQEQVAPWRSPVVPSRDEVMPAEYSGQSELQKLLRSLRPANSNRAKASILFPQSQKREDKTSDLSVAERVRQVEQVASESKGYSTRVNFGAGEATVVDEQNPEPGCHSANQRLYKVSDYPKPVWQRREEAMGTRDASKLKVTDHEMKTERNCRVSSLSHFLGELPTPQGEVGLPRGGKTTTITIDLSLPPSCNGTHLSTSTNYHVNGAHKLPPREVLLSPSLIMRTFQNPGHHNDLETTRSYASPCSSLSSLQEMTQSSGSHLLDDRLNGFSFQSQLTDSRNFINTKETEYCPDYTVNTRKQTSHSYQKSWITGSARGITDGQRSHKCLENGHDEPTPRDKSSGGCKATALSGERDEAEEVVVVNQLDAWRALYCDIDSDLSDDSEKADEEVRSYMSVVDEDGVSSEVSGSWSRATGLKHLHVRECPTGNSASECPDDVSARPQQRSTATAIPPPYNDDCDRLRAVETLVSTRAGQPKITSISLRYGEDNNSAAPQQQPLSTRNTETFKFTSKTSISAERTNSSSNVLASDDKSMPSSYLKPSYASQSYPLSSKITPTTQSYPQSSKITPTTQSYPLSSKITPTTQSYPLSSKITTTTPSYPLSSKITPTTPSYPLSSKITPTHDRNISISRTRLEGSVEKHQSHTKERKTLFDRSDITTSSDVESERRTVAKHMTTQSESPSRGLSFSHFDKKPSSSQKSYSPVSKPVTSCQSPADALTTSEVNSERSTFAKQSLHSEPTSRTATVSSVGQHTSSKVSSSSISKQSSNHTITTNPQNSTTLVNAKIVSSYERKVSNPSNSPLRSQSPRTSFPYQNGEGSDKSASPCHRSSPRSRGSSESQGGVKLDAITSSSCSRVTSSGLQRRDSKEKTSAAVQTHASESNETSQSGLGKTDRLTTDASSPMPGHAVKSTTVGRDSRRVTRSTSKSPTPTKRVTPPSKNSKTKDFIGRVGTDSPTYQNSKNSTSPSNTLSTSAHVQSSSTVAARCEEQVYQNSGMFYEEPLEASNLSNKPERKQYDCGLDLIETDSAILEELTRAADQILQAVNGYTDEESRRASSDDDNRRFKDRRSATLGTISESPLRRLADIRKETSSSSHKTNGTARRTQRVSSKTKLGPTSSTSSVESFTRETRRAAVKTERSTSGATSSRTARMVQRANSRELLLQTNASSSEDIASGTESKKQRAPPPRRSRASSSSNKDPSSSSARSKDKLKDGLDSSRTKERVSTSRGKSRETSDSRESRRKVPETKHHPVKEKTIPAASGLTGGRERGSHARHCTSSTRTTKTPNHQEKTSSSSKRRSESGVQT